MKYSKHERIGANWSTTSKYSDYSIPYPVVNYRDYARTIDEFIEKYPYVTIETSGEANSTLTFGDVGTGHFGTLIHETRNFKNAEFYTEYVVKSHDSAFSYDVGVEIGLQFKIKEETLFLRAFINGWMYSVGYQWRYLDFGLDVTSITFHTEESSIKQAILV